MNEPAKETHLVPGLEPSFRADHWPGLGRCRVPTATGGGAPHRGPGLYPDCFVRFYANVPVCLPPGQGESLVGQDVVVGEG